MAFENILSEIDGQIARLEQAKVLLSDGGSGKRKPGRPKSTDIATSLSKRASVEPVRKRRAMSIAARKKIAAAQKKRWAKFHKAAKAKATAK